jgi:hypothetical protein
MVVYFVPEGHRASLHRLMPKKTRCFIGPILFWFNAPLAGILACELSSSILVYPIDDPFTKHYFIALVVTTQDGARLQTSKDSFPDF